MKVLVFGLGKSGRALLSFYKDKAELWVYDDKEVDLEKLGLEFGKLEFYNPDVDYDLLALSPGPSPDHPVIKELRKKGISIKGELEIAYEHLKGNILAITGTNGKTTTTSLLKAMVEKQFSRTFVAGNIGIPLIGYVLDSKEGDSYVVEVSSFQLETMVDFSPSISAILNITPDHISWHGSMEKYIDAKFRLWEKGFSKQKKIFNADQSFLLDQIIQRYGTTEEFYSFSTYKKLDRGAYMEDGILYLALDERVELLALKDLALKGEHNLSNALAASLMASLYGVKTEIIAEVLKEFEGLEHRYEVLEELKGRRFINDSKATNVDSTLPALKSALRPTVLIAGGMDKKVPLAPLFEAWNPAIKHLVLFGETKLQLGELAKGICDVYIVDNLEEAFSKAMDLSKPGWDILFSPACASWDMYENFEVRGEHFKKLHGRLR
ncbi:MAG: UDP-N-acetylmuramoyl-L-alanine--D-glutamate ligase [Tissierellia bacterium]|nr:UDP-N-acetylmuramoyl-L-alanine--D-glutamate ligase [Tissierellia bacterium]